MRDFGENRFIAGDPLRGYAALAIVIAHAAFVSMIVDGRIGDLVAAGGVLSVYGPVLGSFFKTAYFGFWIFICLSGYLIGRPFVCAIVDGRPLPSLAAYVRHRAFRILPAYWVILTIVLACFVGLLGRESISARQVLGFYLFDFSGGNMVGKSIAQGWSLGLEIRFYALLPVAAVCAVSLLRRVPGRRSRALAIAVPCLIWLVVSPFVVHDEPPLQSLVYFSKLFGAGIGLAALEPVMAPAVRDKCRLVPVASAVVVAAFGYVLAAPVLPYQRGIDGREMADLAMAVTAVTLVAGPMFRQWVDGECWRVMDNRIARWLGSRSYSIYLVHMLALYELGLLISTWASGPATVLVWLLVPGLIASGLLAEVLHRMVERPLIERAHRRPALLTGR